jgi:hypothetical protein
MSRFTKDKNVNTSVSVINTKLASERTLRELVDLQGTDTDALENIESEIQTTNTELQTINTTLNTGNEKTDQSNEKLDNIIEEAELLKRQEVETSTTFDISQWAPILQADSTNPYIEDPQVNRQGWYYINTVQGGSNLYWYSSDAPYGFKSGSELKYGQITEGGGFYVVMWVDKVDGISGLPIFSLYTTPTGSNDKVPSFYKSRQTHQPKATEKLFAGELVLFYNSITILDKIKNVYPTARRVQMSVSGVDTLTPMIGNDETIRFLSINGDSLSPVENQQWCVASAGWFNGVDVVRHYKFINLKTINGVSDVVSHNLLENTANAVGFSNIKLDEIYNENIIQNTRLEENKQELVKINNKLNNKITLINEWFDLNRLISINCISTPTDIGSMVGGWAGGHIAFNNIPFETKVNFEVVSNNANDTLLGSGCRLVRVYGLDEEYNPIIDNISLNGTTPVPLTKQFNHINLISPISFGSGQAVAGEVIIRTAQAPVVQYGSMGSNQVSTGWFKCPGNFRAVLNGVNYTSNSSSSIITIILVRNNVSNAYHTIGRYDCGLSLNINYPIWTLNPGESVYIFQTSAHQSKAVMTFELIPPS